MYTGAFVTISHRDCWLNCALEILLLQILLLTYLLTLLIYKRSRFKGNEKCLLGLVFCVYFHLVKPMFSLVYFLVYLYTVNHKNVALYF